MAVRSCKINIFKDTSGFLFLRQSPWHIWYNAILRGNRNGLSRKDITYILCTDGIQCAGLGCQDVRIVTFTNTKRLESIRVPCSHKLTGTHDNQCIGTFYFKTGTIYCLFCRLRIETFSCNMVCNNLWINGRLENSTCIFQISAKLCRIDQITIMCQRQSTFHIVQYQRLCILTGRSTCCWISGMTYTNISVQGFQILRCEHFIDKSHSFIGSYLSLRTIGLANGNTTALLSSVL